MRHGHDEYELGDLDTTRSRTLYQIEQRRQQPHANYALIFCAFASIFTALCFILPPIIHAFEQFAR